MSKTKSYKNHIMQLIIVTVVIMGLTAQSTFGTNGYFRHGYGIKYGAMAGAGTALSLSSIGAASNPAGLAFLGSSYDFSIALFSPDRSYNITGNPSMFPGTFGLTPGKIESGSKSFPIPTLGANWMLNETMALGVMFFANGGMNTDYETATFFDPTSQETGVNLEQMFFGVTYAIQFAEGHSFGVTPLFAFQRFAAKGLASFAPFSSDATKLTGNRVSTSTGFGARFGYQGKILPQLKFGGSYQIKTTMSEFDEYAGLFAEKGGFDIPASWNVGLAIDATDRFTIAADVQQILYSGVNSIANPIAPMALPPAFLNPGGDPNNPMDYTPNPNSVPLGADNSSGFGWEDVMVYKLGLMYALHDWTLMAGYSYGDNPVPGGEVLFNILAPGIVQHHITLGVTRKIDNSNEVTVAFMYAPAGTVSGANVFEAPNQQTIELEMSQWQLEVGYAFH